MAFLYALSGVCTHLETPNDHETLAERYAHRLAGQWPNALHHDPDSLPALSGRLLGPSSDVPLLLPVGALEAAEVPIGQPGWSMDILSNSATAILTASVTEELLPTGPLQQIKHDVERKQQK